VHCAGMFLCKDRADFTASVEADLVLGSDGKAERSRQFREESAMRLMIEIAAAVLLLFCISASSAAFAAGKAGKSADGLSCAFSVPANASPAARCASIKRQCGGKFYANYCGDKMLSAM
jgi:hypothetical protein